MTHQLFNTYKKKEEIVQFCISLEQIRVFVNLVYLVRNYISLDVESQIYTTVQWIAHKN